MNVGQAEQPGSAFVAQWRKSVWAALIAALTSAVLFFASWWSRSLLEGPTITSPALPLLAEVGLGAAIISTVITALRERPWWRMSPMARVVCAVCTPAAGWTIAALLRFLRQSARFGMREGLPNVDPALLFPGTDDVVTWAGAVLIATTPHLYPNMKSTLAVFAMTGLAAADVSLVMLLSKGVYRPIDAMPMPLAASVACGVATIWPIAKKKP